MTASVPRDELIAEIDAAAGEENANRLWRLLQRARERIAEYEQARADDKVWADYPRVVAKLVAADDRIAELEAELAAARKDAERYKRAVVDLASRGHGVRRPNWLLATIDAALAKGPQ